MSKLELHHCIVCGAPAKKRHDGSHLWIECKKKCGNITHLYPDYPESLEFAAIEWNNHWVDEDGHVQEG